MGVGNCVTSGQMMEPRSADGLRPGLAEFTNAPVEAWEASRRETWQNLREIVPHRDILKQEELKD
jgi:hypothetical protein